MKVPAWNDRVRKTECIFSFDSPETPNGLFVSLSTFQGYGNDYIELDYRRNQNPLYLWIKWTKIPKPPAPKADGAPENPTKLGIGIEGGFQVEEESFDYEKKNFLAIMPSHILIELPNTDLPDLIDLSVQGILKASDLSENEAQVSADLQQFDLVAHVTCCKSLGLN
jgi:ubiquitin carboxyl-terminal hydrolase 5/13